MSTRPNMPSTAAPDDQQCDESWERLWQRRWELLNWANITYRYHRKRQGFFGYCDKTTQAATVVAGAFLFGGAQNHWPLLGVVVSAMGLLALVFGYGDRRQSHKELAEQAARLIGEIQCLPDGKLNEQQLGRWERVRMLITLKEPPNLKTLVSKCEWEQAVAEGHHKHVAAPRWWQQAYMHFF